MALLFKLFWEGRLENMALVGSEQCRASLVHVQDIMRVAHFLSYTPEACGQRYIVTDNSCFTNIEISKILGAYLQNPFIPGIRLPKAVLRYLISTIEKTARRYGVRPEVDSGLTQMMMLNTHSSNAKLRALCEKYHQRPIWYPNSWTGIEAAIRQLQLEGWFK
jgi:nucleoside-diphosphate-sugar epimerase